jgi:U3 small nucleolar RNA-associated protein 11
MAKLVHNVQKKQHRERAQPTERKRFGLLEKKKDYKLRAQDYHRKQDALKNLKAKAANRNPDEYYHAMTSKKTDERGILISEREEEQLSNDQIKLLKTQDSNYIKTLRAEELHKLEKVQKGLSFKSTGKHTVFVKDVNEKLSFDAVKHFGTDKNLIGNRENRLRVKQLATNQALVKELDENSMPKESLDKKRLKKYVQLQSLLKRSKQLQEVEERMNIQREGMKSGDKKKILDASGRKSYKFKAERKR